MVLLVLMGQEIYFLKLLSRVTEPTTGHATVKGRLAALLEVGTGCTQNLQVWKIYF